MIHYFINMCLCSGVFISFYFLFLEKEKFHLFNRCYLLTSLMASVVIPLITWEVNMPATESISALNLIEGLTIQQDTPLPINLKKPTYYPDIDNTYDYFSLLYLVITALLIGWLIIRLIKIYSKINRLGYSEYKGSFLVLTESQHQPFSFLSYIFINKTSFENNEVCDEIIYHELAHTKQNHTFDIILLEFFRALFWLNPFLFLYRRAVITNHEFLADQSVIDEYKDVKNYQRILLDAVREDSTPTLSNQLVGSIKFNMTKKRLKKMTKQKSIMRSTLKMLAVIPLSILLVYIFSDKIIAQNNSESTDVAVIQQNNKTCPDYLKVYCSILTKYDLKGIEPKDVRKVVSYEDQEKMIEIFKSLTPDQQKKQMIGFSMIGGPLQKKTPTSDQLESWKNEKEFGVWLNGKRVKNSVLGSYSYIDFSHFSASRLMRNAAHYGKYTYHLSIMTNEYFQQYNLDNSEKRHHIFHRRKSIGE